MFEQSCTLGCISTLQYIKLRHRNDSTPEKACHECEEEQHEDDDDDERYHETSLLGLSRDVAENVTESCHIFPLHLFQ